MHREFFAFHAVDPCQGMLFMEDALQFSERPRLPLELRFHTSVRAVLNETPDAQSGGTVSYELPESHALHPAAEPEPHPDSRHSGQTCDLK